MVTKALPIALVSLACFTACEKRPANTRADAREDLQEARQEHREDVADAAKKDSMQERHEAVAEADQELAEARREASKDVRDAEIEASYGERFEVMEDETEPQFFARAEKRIADLESRLRVVETRNKNPDQQEDAIDVRRHLDEAKKDLVEMRDPDHKSIDDAKLGVAIAINRAWRALKDLDQETAS